MIQVNEMNLQVAGLSEAEAGELGKQVAERLGGMVSTGNRFLLSQVDLVSIDIKLLPGMSIPDLAREITTGIFQRLPIL